MKSRKTTARKMQNLLLWVRRGKKNERHPFSVSFGLVENIISNVSDSSTVVNLAILMVGLAGN